MDDSQFDATRHHYTVLQRFYEKMFGTTSIHFPLWLPGTDHAGIATQNVVERELAAEGMTRHDLGRERFIEQVWEWRRRYGDRITNQIRRMGSSVDWSRERFTMDDGLSRAVRKVFVQLYEEGLIYQGERIINWCPRCGTALAEIEVEYEEEHGELTHIRYPFVDGEGGVEVATTRPETMLGDTGVAVHPDDERYNDVIGKMVRLPLVDREIPIVADEAVDPEFGTGAVKVTPAHDPNDFDIAERHDLPIIKIFDEEAKVTKEGGRFFNMDRFEAREAVRQALSKKGHLVKVEDHLHSVGHCYRCDTVVEPFLSAQWFVKVRPLVEPSIEAVENENTRFVPKRWEKSYFHWMHNLRDWCVSRQIWWGHRIPAWYCDDCDQTIVAEEDPSACANCGGPNLRQDEDVLDTWFSSALWPFSTLGWPDETEDLAAFYPNTVLITGFDIIYFWVARMMKMGIHFMDDVPFDDVVIHGLIRAADGRKMSKSLGNAIDPLEVAEQHGADPLRLALLQAASPGGDVQVDLDRVEAARRFGNKLWNATRFVLGSLDGQAVPPDGGYPDDPGPADRWILDRLSEATDEFDRLSNEYRFSDAFAGLYHFAWSEVFDWYIEMAKSSLSESESASATRATLGTVLRDLLKLFHPAMPYITEELWSEVVRDGLIAGSSWPNPPSTTAPLHVDIMQELISSVRNFRSQHGVSPKQPIAASVVDPNGIIEDWWHAQLSTLANLTVQHTADHDGKGHTRIVAGSARVFIPLAEFVDLDAEIARIAKRLADVEGDLSKAEAKLANPSFRDRAPAEVVAKEEAKLAELTSRAAQLRAQRDELES